MDVRRPIAGSNLAARQRRKYRRQTLTVGLMTGGTVLRIHLLAERHQFRRSKRLARHLFPLGECGPFLRIPSVVFVFGNGVDDDRHETVVFSAQLGALTAIDAGLVYLCPHVIENARNGISLDAKSGTENEWMTSLPVIRKRTFFFVGITSGLSTSSR